MQDAPTYELTIPENGWQDVDSDRTRLLAVLVINGTYHRARRTASDEP